MYICIYVYVYIYIYIHTCSCVCICCCCAAFLPYTRSPSQDFRLFGPRPWNILATTHETQRFLSNPDPGENLVSGNLVMETGCTHRNTQRPRSDRRTSDDPSEVNNDRNRNTSTKITN